MTQCVSHPAINLAVGVKRRVNATLGSIAAAVGLSLLVISNAARAEAYQDHEQIRDAVAGFAQQELGDRDVEVEVGSLDRRLKLRQCDVPLETFWPPGARRQGRGAIGVRCVDEKPWRMFVRVNIKVYEEVAVLRTSKVRGEALAIADVTFERREVTALRDKYLTDAASVAGYIFRRSAKSGDVVGLRMLKAPYVVKRGEFVTIMADSAGIQITMRGQALSDGVKGSVIRVRNSSSSRVVEGEVVDKGVVKVRF